MQTRFAIAGNLVATLVAATLLMVLAPPVSAAPSTAMCAGTVVISARGSLEKEGSGSAGPVAVKVRDNFKQSVRTDFLTAREYPATVYNYSDSVAWGAKSLRAKLNRLVTTCRTTTKIVLVGYSQGAHVIGDVIDTSGVQLTSAVRNQIKAVILLGDPTFVPGQSYSAGTHDWWPRGIFARSPGSFGAYASRIRSYCNKGDRFCQNNALGGKAADAAHADYKKYTDSAYNFIRSKY